MIDQFDAKYTLLRSPRLSPFDASAGHVSKISDGTGRLWQRQGDLPTRFSKSCSKLCCGCNSKGWNILPQVFEKLQDSSMAGGQDGPFEKMGHLTSQIWAGFESQRCRSSHGSTWNDLTTGIRCQDSGPLSLFFIFNGGFRNDIWLWLEDELSMFNHHVFISFHRFFSPSRWGARRRHAHGLFSTRGGVWTTEQRIENDWLIGWWMLMENSEVHSFHLSFSCKMLQVFKMTALRYDKYTVCKYVLEVLDFCFSKVIAFWNEEAMDWATATWQQNAPGTRKRSQRSQGSCVQCWDRHDKLWYYGVEKHWPVGLINKGVWLSIDAPGNLNLKWDVVPDKGLKNWLTLIYPAALITLGHSKNHLWDFRSDSLPFQNDQERGQRWCCRRCWDQTWEIEIVRLT